MTPSIAAMPPWSHSGWSGVPGRRRPTARGPRRAPGWRPRWTAKTAIGFRAPWWTTALPARPRPLPPWSSLWTTPLLRRRASKRVLAISIPLRTIAICYAAFLQGPHLPWSPPRCVRAPARLGPNMPWAWAGGWRLSGAPGPTPLAWSAAIGMWRLLRSSTGSPPPAGPMVSVASRVRPSCSARPPPGSRRLAVSIPTGAPWPTPLARRRRPVAVALPRAFRLHRPGHTPGGSCARRKACVRTIPPLGGPLPHTALAPAHPSTVLLTLFTGAAPGQPYQESMLRHLPSAWPVTAL
jgi:hypothetical protein